MRTSLSPRLGSSARYDVRLGIESRLDQVDELDRHALAGARLEELLFAGANGSVRQQSANDLEALFDLFGIGGGAVATDEELADVGRNRVGTLELLREVLAHHVALEG